MKSKLKVIMGGAALTLAVMTVPGIAQAYGDYHPRAAQVDQRIAELEMRVDQGLRSGALRPMEARNLRLQIGTIRHNERVFMADGRLDDRELARLQHELDNVSRNVYIGKHEPGRHW